MKSKIARITSQYVRTSIFLRGLQCIDVSPSREAWSRIHAATWHGSRCSPSGWALRILFTLDSYHCPCSRLSMIYSSTPAPAACGPYQI